MPPFLTDSSVWVDHWDDANVDSAPVVYLRERMRTDDVLAGDLIVMEVLRGVRNDQRHARLSQIYASFPQRALAGREVVLAAGDNFRLLQARGITVRSAIDCIIATYCIRNAIPLLHSDRDFDPFEQHLGLRVVR